MLLESADMISTIHTRMVFFAYYDMEIANLVLDLSLGKVTSTGGLIWEID